jgi:hypothetical protein
VFAGSVVRTSYRWDRFVPSGQVGRVANYVATGDMVVAAFPYGLERLGITDLGGAGCRGFVVAKSIPVYNIEFARGGHGAALEPGYWDAITDFVLKGEEHVPLTKLGDDKQSPAMLVLGFLSPLVWVFLLIIVFGIGWFLLAPLGIPAPDFLQETVLCMSNAASAWVWALLFIAYLWVVLTFLRKA